MNVLLIDSDEAGLDFNLRCKTAGHNVKHFIGPRKNNDRSTVGDGLIERVNDWKKWARWADIILPLDNNRYIRDLETFRDYGYPIFGPNLEVTKWEVDRTYGQSVMAPFMKPMPYKTFADFDSAISHVKKTMGRYVSKPCADVAKSLTYCSCGPADMIYMLEKWKKLWGKPPFEFLLQEFCPGIEMAIGGWFGPGGFSKHLMLNFEHKKLMSGDKGPGTGEAGTVARYVKREKLADEMLLPLEKRLKQAKYTGYIDVAVIIKEEDGKPGFLEFTTRPGWPLFHLQNSLHKGDPVMWMADMCNGYDTLDVQDQVSTCIVVAQPDYPYNKTITEGVPIWCKPNKNIHPSQIKAGVAPEEVDGKIVDKECWVSAGNYLLITTGLADGVATSAKRAYKVLDDIKIPNDPIVRDDIGERLEEQLPLLQEKGYAKGISYR